MNIYETDVWEKLKNSDKPVVLYGMGNGADKILERFAQKGIRCADIFASDAFVRGQSFHDMRVKSYSEIERTYDDFIIVPAFATQRAEVLAHIFRLAQSHTVLAPDVPVAGIDYFSRAYYALHEKEFESAFSLLIDDASKACYERIINYKIGGDIALLKPFFKKEKVYSDLLQLQGETIVDLGAYDGDTVREFAAADPAYKKIIALEPDTKNFHKLQKKCAHLRNIEAHHAGAWDTEGIGCFEAEASRNSSIGVRGTAVSLTSVDALIHEPITLLKMDIEGSESKAVAGAAETIRRYRPKLYICAYHRSEDLFALPLQIHALCPDYRFYFCHHAYIPAWESNFYGIIK
ncbi:MAG: FkbM family methyltransferase [Clostridia bacterium]|nr:FkbM family methyltransferase [Clostridia bacterium]